MIVTFMMGKEWAGLCTKQTGTRNRRNAGAMVPVRRALAFRRFA